MSDKPIQLENFLADVEYARESNGACLQHLQNAGADLMTLTREVRCPEIEPRWGEDTLSHVDTYLSLVNEKFQHPKFPMAFAQVFRGDLLSTRYWRVQEPNDAREALESYKSAAKITHSTKPTSANRAYSGALTILDGIREFDFWTAVREEDVISDKKTEVMLQVEQGKLPAFVNRWAIRTKNVAVEHKDKKLLERCVYLETVLTQLSGEEKRENHQSAKCHRLYDLYGIDRDRTSFSRWHTAQKELLDMNSFEFVFQNSQNLFHRTYHAFLDDNCTPEQLEEATNIFAEKPEHKGLNYATIAFHFVTLPSKWRALGKKFARDAYSLDPSKWESPDRKQLLRDFNLDHLISEQK